MKTYIPYSLILAAASAGMAFGAETAYTTPVGYVSQTVLKNSDTILGVPLKAPTVAAAALSANPTIGATDATLTVSTASFGSYGTTSYVKFTSGPDSGSVFAILSNTATTITIDRNGATLNAVSGDTFSVTPFSTLDSLFPPALATNDPLTTGTAIVASATVSNPNRRTQLLLADTVTANINLAAAGTYYVLAAQAGPPAVPAQWRKVGDTTLANVGGLQLWPDAMFTLRHPVTVTANTTYTNAGEVSTSKQNILLYTRVGSSAALRDNPRAITRPVDVTLNGLNLGGTAGFVSSPTVSNPNRRDTLIVFDNSLTAQNKSASATYYYLAAQAGPPAIPAQWRKVGDTTLADVGNDVIKAGNAFIIRKYGTATGATALWTNTPSY